MILEEGKRYVTRHGKVTGYLCIGDNGCFLDPSASVTGYGWFKGGNYFKGDEISMLCMMKIATK